MSPLLPNAVRQRRLAAYTAEWTAIRRSTAPADHPQAERAIRELYVERGLAEPDILWVPSPMAAVTAWHVASQSRAPVRNPYTRGEHGTGANRAFRALADPFGLEPAWQERALGRARTYLPDAIIRNESGWPRIVVHEFELPEVHTRSAIETAILAANGVDPRLRRGGARIEPGPTPSDRPPGRNRLGRDRELARRIMGTRWDILAATIGEELLEEVALDGLARTVNELLDVRRTLRDALQAMDMPQHSTSLLGMGLLAYVLDIPAWRLRIQREERARMIERRLAVARSVGAWWALEGLAICSERPTRLHLDERSRLHAIDGPAIAWSDGSEVWADHGVVVPGWLVTHPERLTVKRIDAEHNAEVRRVMVERFGAERLLRNGDAELVSEDSTGRLWLRHLRDQAFDEEPVAMVEVRNSTAEDDGSHRTYFLRVPPDARSAREAVAWTFGLEEEEYTPAAES